MKSMLGLMTLLLPVVALAAEPGEVKQLLIEFHDRDISVRQAALRELNKIGPESAGATALLIQELAVDNLENRQILTAILAKIGKGAVPGLMEALDKEPVGVRRQILLALAKIGPDAKASAGKVALALKDSNKEIRTFALATLLRIDPKGEATVAGLGQAMEDPEKGVRLGALYSLEELVKTNEQLQPLLLKGLGNSEWEVRLATAALLSRLGGQIKGAMPALVAALKDEDGRVRNNVSLAIILLEPKESAQPLDVLMKNLGHKDADVRRGAAYVVGEIGPGAQAAIPRLKELVMDPKPEVRLAAERSLELIQAKK